MTSQAVSRVEPAETLPGRLVNFVHRRRVEIGLFLLSFAVRSCLLPWVYSLRLAGDEVYYWRSVALSVAHGSILTIGQQLRPPLWGYALSLAALISNHAFCGRLFSVLLGSLTAAFVYLLGARAFDKRTGVLAGLIFAVYPEHVYFSHYLWPETLFGLILVIATLLYLESVGAEAGDSVVSRSGQHGSRPSTNCKEKSATTVRWTASVPSAGAPQKGLMTAASILCGIALLTKEFAVIPFAGMLLLAPASNMRERAGTIARCCVWFFLPAVIYSLLSWAHTGKPVFLSRAPVANLRQTVGYAFNPRVSYGDIKDFTRAFVRKTPREHWQFFQDQTIKIWSQNSFPVARLLAKGPKPRIDEWKYQRIPFRKTQAVAIGATHIVIMIVGLLGLLSLQNVVFRRFAIVNFCLLTAFGAFALMVSRFRLPFFFLMILSASYAIVHADEVGRRLRNGTVLVMAILLLSLLALIVAKAWHLFGIWA
jgi:4-amino-4-deoxy-L-arabinose transferase-like glycosyltransferase